MWEPKLDEMPTLKKKIIKMNKKKNTNKQEQKTSELNK